MNKAALIVHTCDRYQLLYKGFYYFFKKNWPLQELPISNYFFTEEVDYAPLNFNNIKTGKGEWSDRLLSGLKQIPEEYVIYFQEDMWLSKPIGEVALTQIINFCVGKQVSLFKLSSNSIYKTYPTETYTNGLSVSVLDNKKSGYLMSHQVSVWNKSFLMEQLKYKEHPWRNERKGTKRLKKLNPVIYQADLFSENEQLPNNENNDLSSAGSYFTVSQNGRLNGYAHPFINIMKLDDDADIREYAATLEHHLKQGITHDGQSQPRKGDLFKKIKNYLSGVSKL